MSKFQIHLGHHGWKDYEDKENKVLNRAFQSGMPKATVQCRGQKYSYDFEKMEQVNLKSGTARSIRPPRTLKRPSAPIVPAGPTLCIKVPKGTAGKTIQVPHPVAKGQFFQVRVPPGAKPGQAMLVPIPAAEPEAATTVGSGENPEDGREKRGTGVGGKVAKGAAGVAAVAGVAVAGAIIVEAADPGAIGEAAGDLGEALGGDVGAAVADAGAAVGDWAGDAGEAIADFGEDAVEWCGDAAEDVGDFVMDLF